MLIAETGFAPPTVNHFPEHKNQSRVDHYADERNQKSRTQNLINAMRG